MFSIHSTINRTGENKEVIGTIQSSLTKTSLSYKVTPIHVTVKGQDPKLN